SLLREYVVRTRCFGLCDARSKRSTVRGRDCSRLPRSARHVAKVCSSYCATQAAKQDLVRNKHANRVDGVLPLCVTYCLDERMPRQIGRIEKSSSAFAIVSTSDKELKSRGLR